MNKIFRILIIVLLGLMPIFLYAQMAGLHGNEREIRKGLHDGNLFRVTVYNDGTFGSIDNTVDFAGEWPVGTGHIYLVDGNTFIGGEVIDTTGQVKHIISENRSSMISYSTGDQGPNGEWWTFLPLTGFANSDNKDLAMSHMSWSWPEYWPDIRDPENKRYSADGWAGSWNGYFGRDVKNAEEESYFVADDYNNREFLFYPDSLDKERRGLGLRMYVRGFQWANALVEDGIFTLFDIENVGTVNHDKMVFGYKVGNNMGQSISGSDADSGDDCGAFNKDEDLAYLYDYDDIGGGGWSPVGCFGGAFLESPGNPYDGIDNDGDGANGSGGTVSQAMFLPSELTAGQNIILIDYSTFERTKIQMPDDTIYVHFEDQVFKFWPGKMIQEVDFNLVDDNLNGLIDESNGAEFGEPGAEVRTYLYEGARCIDYFTDAGKDNLLIDERRDDGIDNDGDWNPEKDDVGADGIPYTNDAGEKDGVPSPGEPHYDALDIDESDMLGLTSFTLYKWETMPHYDDEKVWDNLIPGLFDDRMERNNIELLWGSGYFPLKAGKTERFSMGLIAGVNEADITRNKHWFAEAYNLNYNFSKAPDIPTVYAVAGDHKVTLYWDDVAESSVDPISGQDFEGYRIYRSTDLGWNDMPALTDQYGIPTSIRIPLAQFDIKDDGYQGAAPVDIEGVHFWLGDNTGLYHSYVDTTAKNGFEYYYAVTSYDHGDPVAWIAPTECTKALTRKMSGEYVKGPNVVIVRPEAPVAGHVAAKTSDARWLDGSTTSGNISIHVIEPDSILDRTYQVVFVDSTTSKGFGFTKSFSLVDVTNNDQPDTVFSKCTMFHEGDEAPLTQGFRLILHNDEDMGPNTDQSGWAGADGVLNPNLNIYNYAFAVYSKGIAQPHDYEIIFGDSGMAMSTEFQRTSSDLLESRPVNFMVRNTTLNCDVAFALWERDGDNGMFSAFQEGNRSDNIIFLEPDSTNELVPSWQFNLSLPGAGTEDQFRLPRIGEQVKLVQYKPFLNHDVYEFQTKPEYIDKELAKAQMAQIKVVPNPYIVSNSWEPQNPYGSGRGPRELHFTHLPPKCTIKIFNIKGYLVDTIEHDVYQSNSDNPDLWDGTAIWDMLTKDELEISFGIYIYHVDAGEYGNKIGKFAVIK